MSLVTAVGASQADVTDSAVLGDLVLQSLGGAVNMLGQSNVTGSGSVRN